MRIDINIYQLFQVQAGRNMYSVSSDGSCGFVTEQSKPLGSKKGAAATVAFSILKFLQFVPLALLVPCAKCHAKRKVGNLPKIVVAFLDPKSQSLDVSMSVHARSQRLKEF